MRHYLACLTLEVLNKFMWEIEKVVKKGDYQYALVRDHPNRTKNNYVLLHRVVAENKLGRMLNAGEVVHHINHDRYDNRPENLEVLSKIEHLKLHGKESKERAVWVRYKCPECESIFERVRRNTPIIKGGQFAFCSRHCNGVFSRRKQMFGETEKYLKAIEENYICTFTHAPIV